MNFIFLGPPGAGKGSLAVKVAEDYKIPHISTGDIFRAAIKNQTELGKKVKAIIDSGALVSDDLTCELVKDRLSQPDTQNGFILDGFPRTIPQAEMFTQICSDVTVLECDLTLIEISANFSINSLLVRLSSFANSLTLKLSI
jgi:adenylate kinase